MVQIKAYRVLAGFKGFGALGWKGFSVFGV